MHDTFILNKNINEKFKVWCIVKYVCHSKHLAFILKNYQKVFFFQFPTEAHP